MTQTPDAFPRRQRMGLLAKAQGPRLQGLMPDLPPHRMIRGPEIGSMMVQGRVGGIGAPFNLGEMTVTRATIALEDGTLGHAMVQGRGRDHALRAALIDALAEKGAPEAAALLHILASEAASARTTRAAKAEATRVEFFTLQRGED